MKFLLLILISLNAFAGPSETDCRFYLEVEESFKCGPRGYLLNFGHRLCEKYLRAEPHARSAVQLWFPKVRFCLQDFISTGTFLNCDDLRKQALDSHVGCYKSTGFCELSGKDERQILRMTGGDVFRPSVLSLAFKVKSACEGASTPE